MDIAFHFDADAIKAHYPNQPYNIPILDKIFRSLLAANLNAIHLKIFEGNLLIDIDTRNDKVITKLLDGLLGTQFRTWQNINTERLREAIISSRVYVVLLVGLSNHIRVWWSQKSRQF